MNKRLTPVELQAKGIRILVRELGYSDAMRFMLQYSSGSGDYTKERKKLLANVTLEDLIEKTKERVASAKAAKKTRRSA